MILRRSRLALGAGLLFGLVGHSGAVPAVNVAVRAAFEAPPYLVELLETAAQENPSSYFPLLDKIADGFFDGASSDQELYHKFRDLLHDGGHLSNSEDLSSFDLALSIHSAAPRIAAHYQFYNTSVRTLVGEEQSIAEGSWAYASFTGQAYTSPDLDAAGARQLAPAGQPLRQLPFDRVSGDPTSDYASVLYADILSDSFRAFHKTLRATALEGKTSYRVRYKPSQWQGERPLSVSGYGVELALKRTDYIVIDDRQAEEAQKDPAAVIGVDLTDTEVSDLRPLSASEVQRLGLKAASFIIGNDKPMDMLAKLTQDFPRYSSAIASMNVSKEFLKEHNANRATILPSGYNVIWINGVQILPRDINIYSLLEFLRRERKMIAGVKELGLTGAQAIDLLSHESIAASRYEQEVQRYDWRDDVEGGGVIVWLNDLEKDKRYKEWPSTVDALLQRTYPGQLPSLSRDIHNLVMAVDLANFNDATLVVEHLQSFVKRNVPIRFGLIPRTDSPTAEQQAKIVYHLLDTYGLSAVLSYLEESLKVAGRKFGPPQETVLAKSVHDRKLRRDRSALALPQILDDERIGLRTNAAQAYSRRLALQGDKAPLLVNGVAVPNTEDWLQVMSQKVSSDLRILQQAVYTQAVGDDDYLPDTFLASASLRRSPLVIPEDEKTLRHVNLGELPQFADLHSVPASAETIERELVHMTIVADIDAIEGFQQLMEALLFQREHDNVELAWLHVPGEVITHLDYPQSPDTSYVQGLLAKYDQMADEEKRRNAVEALDGPQRLSVYTTLFGSCNIGGNADTKQHNRDLAQTFASIQLSTNLEPDQQAIIVNGRIVGPFARDTLLELDDLETLFAYERKQRLLPASLAIQALHLEEKAASPFAFAKISNLIALSQISDVPEGIYDAAPTLRASLHKKWDASHTVVTAGDIDTATTQIVASLDPASEMAQRWVPILKTVSELHGVHTSIFLNPKDRLDELPVKRFYRHVLEPKPEFDQSGAVADSGAIFSSLPADALLNIGMDLPPSWLVAPKDSVHDLDNIKLSAIRSGADIEAIYELEHILIEGHSNDVTTGQPPRGAQLVLGTETDRHFADTIIMANLGYFQFKANPGVYKLSMQQGRSEEIFSIDSPGVLGSSPQDVNNTEISLMSFGGVTLFPKVSRKPDMEAEDVLEPSKSSLESLANSADKLLAQAGLQGSEYFAKAAKFGSSLLSGGGVKSTDVAAQAHADINIFSVASGHLYERMLNIMMLSVMKHTSHTVKFWFIEQFLSPSFKDFLPVIAAEYGFKYEMVTYKWPHWLRGQKEKQREIWGYKILFLDVLFPLDLDKVIFVDADQIVRTDMYELVEHDLQGAPYGFTPMCDSRVEMEGFRFWKQGYWKNFLRGLPYHISALYVVDLKKFRQIAAGDRLRQQYHTLSADPGSLSNLDQDLPNHMQMSIPIHSLPQDWLWCESWCSDEALQTAKTIDLCNNPQTKEPKLDRARRQVPEWTVYDEEIAALAKKLKAKTAEGQPIAGDAADAGAQGLEEESIQERLQREDAERDLKEKQGHDEL